MTRWLRKRWLKPLVSIGLLAIIFYILPWKDVRIAVARLSFGIWALVLVGFLSGHRLGVAKWRLLVNAGRARLSSRDAIRCYAAGLFANLCLPTVVGGDVVRATLAARATGRPEAAFFGSAADRAIDIVVTAVLIACGGVLARNHFRGWTGELFAVGVLVGVLVVCALIPMLVRRPLARWPRKLRRPAGRSLVVLRRMSRSPRAAIGAAAISLCMQGGFVLLNAWIGRAIGITVPLSVWFFVWPLAKIAGLLPISLGGLAVRDATLAALLAPAGVPLTLGVVTALVWQSVMIAGGLTGGLVWWALSGRRVPWRDVAAAGETQPMEPSTHHA
jgi:uncharacterized membrane protein YbhN (UPF0104 family)